MNDPNSFPIREIDSELAKELAEVEIQSHDVETALHQMIMWLEHYAPRKSMSREERALSIALFRDAVVQLVGCFDKSSASSIPVQEVFKSPEDVAFFERLKDMRDAFAAHKFGPYRQCVVGVSVSSTKERTVHFASQVFTGYLSDEDNNKIVLFICDTMAYLTQRMQVLIPVILKSLEGLTDEQLNALPVAETFPVNHSEVRMSRENFFRVKRGRGPATKRSSRSDKKPSRS